MLKPRQQLFVERYLSSLNATKAAIEAGYSERTANEQAARLMARPDVRAAIEAAAALRNGAARVDATWLLRRLADEVEADLADIFDANDRLKPLSEWPEIWRGGLVAGVETEELFAGSGEDRRQVGVVRKVRLSDRVRRLELLGKHVQVGAFREVVEHRGLDGLAERLERAARRLHDRGLMIDAETDAEAASGPHDATLLTAAPAAPAPALAGPRYPFKPGCAE